MIVGTSESDECSSTSCVSGLHGGRFVIDLFLNISNLRACLATRRKP